MTPASATRPDAVTVALFEAIRPLLIPSETEAPLLQASFDDAICTFQSPSKVDAAADVAVKTQCREQNKARGWKLTCENIPMMGPLCSR